MPRLSVDIDLVYTDLTIPSRELVLVEIEKALHDVAELLSSKLGATVRPIASGTDHESKLFISRGPALLKVEVNHVFVGRSTTSLRHVGPTSTRTFLTLSFRPYAGPG